MEIPFHANIFQTITQTGPEEVTFETVETFANLQPFEKSAEFIQVVEPTDT
jgi:hypothetical protein